MKKRTRFVSNSSTSSYCLYGTGLSREQLDELEKRDDIPKSYGEPDFSALGLTYYYTAEWDDDVLVVGRNYTSIKDDETGEDFKKDVQEKISKLLGKEVRCCHLEDAWRDG